MRSKVKKDLLEKTQSHHPFPGQMGQDTETRYLERTYFNEKSMKINIFLQSSFPLSEIS